MGLFRFNYDKEGPGVDKNAPPKKGIARWWEVFVRDFSALMLINILLIVCALPCIACLGTFYLGCESGQPTVLPLVLNLLAAIPFGPAVAAMYRLTMQMARDVPFFTFHEFKKAYKQDFKQGAVSMVILAALFDAILFNIYLLGTVESYPQFTLIMLMFSIVMWFALLNAIYQQIAMLELTMGNIWRNAVLMIVVSGWRGWIVVLIDTVLFIAGLLYGLFVLPLFLFGFFGFTTMTTNLIFWPRFEQLFITKNFERKQRRSAAEEWGEMAEEEEKKAVEKAPTAEEMWAKEFLAQRETAADGEEENPEGKDAEE